MECPACPFVFYNNPNPCVACIISNDIIINDVWEEVIVLVRRKFDPNAGEWCLPCGYVDAWEHPADACIREVKEETSLEIDIDEILYSCNSSLPDKNNLVIFYLAKNIKGELKAGDDALEAKWFTKETLPEICFKSHKEIVKQWW
jgi:ADP-ribose pyrophosphatase YjhB (NUDIX family)